MNPQGCGRQDHNDHSSEWDAPVTKSRDLEHHTIQAVPELGSQDLVHETVECHKVSCAPPGRDGTVPDEGHLSTLGEALARSGHNNASTEPLRWEKLTYRHSRIGDQDLEVVGVQDTCSEQLGASPS